MSYYNTHYSSKKAQKKGIPKGLKYFAPRYHLIRDNGNEIFIGEKIDYLQTSAIHESGSEYHTYEDIFIHEIDSDGKTIHSSIVKKHQELNGLNKNNSFIAELHNNQLVLLFLDNIKNQGKLTNESILKLNGNDKQTCVMSVVVENGEILSRSKQLRAFGLRQLKIFQSKDRNDALIFLSDKKETHFGHIVD